jgi:type VI secretion system protein ImpK
MSSQSGSQDPHTTIIRQTTGRRMVVASSSERVAAPPRAHERVSAAATAYRRRAQEEAAGNVLLREAAPLFAAIRQLRRAPPPASIDRMRDALREQLRVYEAELHHCGVPQKKIEDAKYVLCALIDEVIGETPWGQTAAWNTQPLSKDRNCGVNFFRVKLHEASSSPASNVDLLEVMFACLAMGFRGRFALMQGGEGELSEIKAGVESLIRTYRGPLPDELSPMWRGVEDRAPRVARLVPWWVYASALGVFLALVYSVLNVSINESSYPVQKALMDLHAKKDAGPPQPINIEPAPAGLNVQRLIEIMSAPHRSALASGQLELVDEGNALRMIVWGDDLWRSLATLSAGGVALLESIGRTMPGAVRAVIVEGHTDTRPVRTYQFGSNFELSKARAESGARALRAAGIPANKLRLESYGDTHRVTDPRHAANLAAQRRLEIVITP